MKKKIVLTLVALAGVFGTQAQTAAGIQWERTFGGSEKDFASQVKPTSDGGCVLGGYSYSSPSGTKTSAAYGLGDYWVVKLDVSGNKQWDRSFGGTNFDGIHALQQTSDGGYILGGISFSDASGNKNSAHYGSGDYWVVRLDASGNKLWDNSFGGTSNEVLRSLQQTSDGGYILGGSSYSNKSAEKTENNRGTKSYATTDYWIVKLSCNASQNFYPDLDGDGYGNADSSISLPSCYPPPGYAFDSTDCDEANPLIYPGATEICNGIDDNCNATTDEGIGFIYFADTDSDGFGNPGNTIDTCAQPIGYTSDNTDCDDTNASVYPGAPEILFNGIDGHVQSAPQHT